MRVADLLVATAGSLHCGETDQTFSGVVTDTRDMQPGALFVALRGERFDGNDFVDEAIQGGAAAVVCTRPPARVKQSTAVVVVDDTLRALGDLAAFHRRRFDVPVVAITGSNGKTTTKELLKSILSRAFSPREVLANRGNLNNLIGMPLSLLRLTAAHRVVVLEFGMNRLGEIARLTEIARPDVGLITTIGCAHLEGVGGIDGVAKAKGELFAGLGTDAVAVVNVADDRVRSLADAFHGEIFRVGAGGDMYAEEVEFPSFANSRFRIVTSGGSAAIDLPLAGRHNVDNALAASACALVLGVGLGDIAEGLAKAECPPMRLDARRLPNGVMLVDDSYNANPDSVIASLDALAAGGESAGRCIVVLGGMHELGEAAEAEHRRVGTAIGELRPALVCALGEFAAAVAEGARSRGIEAGPVLVCADHGSAAEAVARCWQPGDTVLVKGSRASAMEKVVESLERMAV